MRLSVKQKATLLRMKTPYWRPPKGNGCVQYGFGRTLYSLKDKGLVTYLRPGDLWRGEPVEQGGWILTKNGEAHASIVEHEVGAGEHKDAAKIRKEATR